MLRTTKVSAVGVAGLIGLLGDAVAPVRSNAAWALGALDDARATEPLARLSTDADPSVRRQAAWALGHVGGQ